MKKNTVNLLILSVILLLPIRAFAFIDNVKPNIGISYVYTNVNDPDYDYVNEYEMLRKPKEQLQTPSIGLSKFFDNNNFNLSISTNRLLNNSITRDVKRRTDGVIFQNKNKTIIDSLTLSYRIDRVNFGLLLMNVKVDKSLYYQNLLVGGEIQESVLSGFNIGYFMTRNIITSFSYILPNSKLDLESGFAINLNYIF